MIDYTAAPTINSVQAQIRRTRRMQALGTLGWLGLTGLIALVGVRTGPNAALIAWLLFVGCILATLINPRYGLYLTIGLSLVSDRTLAYWYPFVKNFSSHESLLFLHNAAIVSPLELFLCLVYVSWLGRFIVQRKPLKLYFGPLFWPPMIFIAFISFGLLHGLARGGNLTIALWEVRAIYYLPMMFFLASNLIETRRQLSKVIWIIAIALFIKGLFGVVYVGTELSFKIGTVDRIAEHVMSILFNSMFVLVIALMLFRGRPLKLMVFPILVPVMALSHLANNRRSSFIALGVALVFLGIALYFENRRLFWTLAPPFALLGVIYLAAFWNSSGALGLPANAVKSVLGEPDERDASSNLYRMYENMNIMFTIKTAPITGVGFGNKFLFLVSMADISSHFVFWEYITHNSVLWVWMKAGAGGFLSMIFMIGTSIMLGARRVLEVPPGELRAIAAAGTAYIVMHFIFTYVDMAWDPVSMVYIGTIMGIINCLPRIADHEEAQQTPRWPWQEIGTGSTVAGR